MILQLIKNHKCSVLFCEDEEIGCIGANKFIKTAFIDDLSEMKYLIELDRKGNSDLVFYSCDNKDFEKFLVENTGYETAWGSLSDISYLAPACGVAAVNFSCGYYSPHSKEEEVRIDDMLYTVDVIDSLLDVECEQFEYVEKKYSYGYYGRDYDRNLSNYYSHYYDDDDYYYGYYGNKSSSGYGDMSYNSYPDRESVKHVVTLYVVYNVIDEEGYDKEVEEMLEGTSITNCFGEFFMSHPDICFNDVLDYYFT